MGLDTETGAGGEHRKFIHREQQISSVLGFGRQTSGLQNYRCGQGHPVDEHFVEWQAGPGAFDPYRSENLVVDSDVSGHARWDLGFG